MNTKKKIPACAITSIFWHCPVHNADVMLITIEDVSNDGIVGGLKFALPWPTA